MAPSITLRNGDKDFVYFPDSLLFVIVQYDTVFLLQIVVCFTYYKQYPLQSGIPHSPLSTDWQINVIVQ